MRATATEALLLSEATLLPVAQPRPRAASQEGRALGAASQQVAALREEVGMLQAAHLRPQTKD